MCSSDLVRAAPADRRRGAGDCAGREPGPGAGGCVSPGHSLRRAVTDLLHDLSPATRREHYLMERLRTALHDEETPMESHDKYFRAPAPAIFGGDCAPAPLRQGWHQWWCVGIPCSCLPEWIAWDAQRQVGGRLPSLPLDLVEGRPCLACEGKAEQTEPSGLRMPCAPGDGTRHPKCRGNGGGRMSPAQRSEWERQRAQSVVVSEPCSPPSASAD